VPHLQRLLILFPDYQGVCLCPLPSRYLLFAESEQEKGQEMNLNLFLPLFGGDAKSKSVEKVEKAAKPR